MILCDCHEPDEIVEEIRKKVPVNKIRLSYGDYSFSDTILERKTMSDFFSSLKSKRLAEQMENISRHYTDKYLIVEGFFDFSHVNNPNYLFNQLALISINFDVQILFSVDQKSTAFLIKKLYYKHRFGCVKKHVDDDKIIHLSRFFGISKEKTKSLLVGFKNIRSMANAKKKDLKKIDKIGSDTASKVEDALNKDVI